MDKAIEKLLAENFDMDMLSSKYTMYYDVEIVEGDIEFETTTIYIKLNEHEKVLYRELKRVFIGIIMYDGKLREQRKPPQLEECNTVKEENIILKEILDNKIRTQADVDLIVKELCKKYWWDAGIVGYLTLGELSPKSKLVDEYISIVINKIKYTDEVSITEPSIIGGCKPSDNAQLYVYTKLSYADIHSSDKLNEAESNDSSKAEEAVKAEKEEYLKDNAAKEQAEQEREEFASQNFKSNTEKEKVSEDCVPYYSKGLKYFTQGNLDSAIDYFTDAIKCNDNYAPAYFYRARSYWRKKKFDCAVEDIMRALRIAEHDSSAFETVEDLHLADVYFDLGLLHSEISELEKAAEYYHKAQPLLERLSVSSSKRRADYQKLEMLIMSNYARIQNENNTKENDTFIDNQPQSTLDSSAPQDNKQNSSSYQDTQNSKLQKQYEKECVRQKAKEPRIKTEEEYQLEKEQKENLLRNGLSIGIALTGLLLMVASGAGLLIGMPMVVGVIYYNLVHHKVIKPIDFKKVFRQVIKQVIKLSKKTIQVAKNITKQVIKLAKKVIKLVKKQVIALCANVIKHLEDSKET